LGGCAHPGGLRQGESRAVRRPGLLWARRAARHYGPHPGQPLADEAAYDATELHEDAFPTLAVLRERWRIEQQEMRAYLDRLTEETLNGTIRYVIPGAIRERVVWHILLEVIIHATQHRSEAAALLTSYGQSPGDFDFLPFPDARA